MTDQPQGEAMTCTMTRGSISVRVCAVLMAALALLVAGSHGAAASPFDTLLGSWGGSGQIRLDDGRTERIRCNAYYTGGGAQLGMAIRCASENYNIEMRSKLSYSGGAVSGNWEERTFNARGEVRGRATSNNLRLSISGNITGSMSVSYSRSSQSVSISTEGIALKSVSIRLSRS